MFERLAGKNTIITGASSGFGWSTALLFAKYGSNLILTARRENLLQELRNEISKINPEIKVYTMKLDVSDHAAIKEEFKKLPGWASKIDILINNAGLGLGSDPVKDVPESTIDIMLNTNVKGLIWMTQQVLPQMIKANEGQIINVGSISGFLAYPNNGVYSATKHAVHAITDALRMETLATNIKVSEVMPGLAKTDFLVVKFGGDEAKTDSSFAGYPALSSEDVAEVIAFTASTKSRSVVSSVTVMPIGQASSIVIRRNPQ
ncbi:hypothetical protein BB559_006890 [Furculomyces boomerangus]|uniref:Uncharacterized protein n=2 Tax=Harpellales TaxID=61421 RepID=A0A2T9XZZ0_9FUNG|nr:hypothetical protein BB559_006890 [Furculomyces boomerangus]PWA00848.1 hypothetical protein BB558_003072 [Smittium angustum]